VPAFRVKLGTNDLSCVDAPETSTAKCATYFFSTVSLLTPPTHSLTHWSSISRQPCEIDGWFKLTIYCQSNGHVNDDVTWPNRWQCKTGTIVVDHRRLEILTNEGWMQQRQYMDRWSRSTERISRLNVLFTRQLPSLIFPGTRGGSSGEGTGARAPPNSSGGVLA